MSNAKPVVSDIQTSFDLTRNEILHIDIAIPGCAGFERITLVGDQPERYSIERTYYDPQQDGSTHEPLKPSPHLRTWTYEPRAVILAALATIIKRGARGQMNEHDASYGDPHDGCKGCEHCDPYHGVALPQGLNDFLDGIDQAAAEYLEGTG